MCVCVCVCVCVGLSIYLSHTYFLTLSLSPSLPPPHTHTHSHRMYPPITSDATRAEYKKIFNEEYQEYLSLKAQVEIVNKEVTALGDQVAAVKKGTEEAKVGGKISFVRHIFRVYFFVILGSKEED